MSKSVKYSTPPTSKAIQSRVIAIGNGFKVNEITLLNGSLIKEHSTSVPTFFIVLKGQVAFKYSNETIILSENEFINIQTNALHTVQALTDSKVLLVK